MKNNILKYFFLSMTGFLSFVFSLVKYIQSYEIYSDEYGTDIAFNSDYIIALLVSLCILLYGIYKIIATNKGYKESNAYVYTGLCISSLLSFYPLGIFFKAMNKQKPVSEYLNYLYLGIVALFLLFYYLFTIISSKKPNA